MSCEKFRKYLKRNKVIMEFIALIIASLMLLGAFFGILLPLLETQKATKLANESLKATQESNQLTRESLDLARQEMQISYIPFISFRILKPYTNLDTNNFLDIMLENHSDAPALAIVIDTYIDGKEIRRAEEDVFGDLMPHEKAPYNLGQETYIKDKIFKNECSYEMDIVSKDILGNIYHHKRKIRFLNDKYEQIYSEFYCDKISPSCPQYLIKK